MRPRNTNEAGYRIRLRHVAAVAAAMALVGLYFAPVWLDEAASRTNAAEVHADPSLAHPLGTDGLGRDVLLRTVVAGRTSLTLAVAGAGLAAAIGFPFGLVIPLLPRSLRRVALRIIDLTVAFPPLIFALLVTAIMGLGGRGAVIAIGLGLAPTFARTAGTLSSSIAGRDFIVACRLLNLPRRRVVFRHVLPNIADTLIIQSTVGISTSLIAISSLSFLGIGVQPPDADWGRMLTEGLREIHNVPTLPLGPATAIILTGIMISFVGEQAVAHINPLRRRARRTTMPSVAGITSPVPEATFTADADHRFAESPDRALLSARGLTVTFPGGGSRPDDSARHLAVNDVDVEVGRGEAVGVVGESGSGKTTLALALAGLSARSAAVHAQRLVFDDVDVSGDVRRRADPRALTMAVVFQDPASSFNPALRVGTQLTEGVRAHDRLSRQDASAAAAQRLADVEIDHPRQRLRQFPHELSGGMRQRALLAMGLMGDPRLIIADEPTSALDVTVQAGVLDLVQRVIDERDLGLVLISHDISVVAQVCDRIMVMYRGAIVEEGPVDQVLRRPAHPYTQALLAAIPTLETDPESELIGLPADLEDVSVDPASGCSYAPRCPLALPHCWQERPALMSVGSAQQRAACWVAQGEASGRASEVTDARA